MAEAALGTRGARRSRPGRSDKDLRPGLPFLPALARAHLRGVAAGLGCEGLVILLTDYYLRPAEAVAAQLVDEGLVVEGFEHPIEVADADREPIARWLGLSRRPHDAAGVHNLLSGRLRRALVARLRELEEGGGPESCWREELRCGVRELRQVARDRFAVAVGGDEASYHECCHDQDAPLEEPLYWRLGPAAAGVLTRALDHEAAEVKARMTPEASAGLEALG